MSTLYRKYRPSKFEEIIGQENIVKILQNSIAKKNISHAYLFCGGRGTGKTTTARIFAQALDISPEDIIEIDAASNRNIADIDRLKESLSTMPFSSDKKIYIIDEVHMLSGTAFNALLKTIEEPPSHVVFILATTELHKVPQTIKSRCQIFNFISPSIDQIMELLLHVSKKEGISLTKETLQNIASVANGSYRDALTYLQKIIDSSETKKVDHDDASDILGIVSSQYVYDILKNCETADIAGILKITEKINDLRIDASEIFDNVIELFRKGLMFKHGAIIDQNSFWTNDEEKMSVESLIEKNKILVNTKTLEKLLDYRYKQSSSPIAVLPLELALIEILGKNT